MKVTKNVWSFGCRSGKNYVVLLNWLPRCPELTECDFFLWELTKDFVYMPLLPTTMNELRHRITAALEAVTEDMFAALWDEFKYGIDICRASQGWNIEHL